MRRAKSILEQFKTAGNVTTTLGTLPKQYHVNSSDALLIFGSVNYTKVYDHINSIRMNKVNTYYPVKYMNNRASLLLWISDFYDSNHGDHNELNFSTYISKTDQLVEYNDIDIDETPFCLFNTITDSDTVASTPCAIYNNDPKVVSYNTEFLNLPVKLAKGDGLKVDGNNTTFEWIDDETNDIIIKGNAVKTQSFKDMYALYNAIGFKALWNVISAPYMHSTVVNLYGLSADVYVQAPKQHSAIFSWNDNSNNIDIKHEIIKQFEYKPLICSHYQKMRFVYQPSEQDQTQ